MDSDFRFLGERIRNEREKKKINSRGNFKSHSKNGKDAIRKEL